jgi:hypothetical protein
MSAFKGETMHAAALGLPTYTLGHFLEKHCTQGCFKYVSTPHPFQTLKVTFKPSDRQGPEPEGGALMHQCICTSSCKSAISAENGKYEQ